MPVVHPYAPGAKGKAHGSDYIIENPETACVDSAKWQLGMLYLLLTDNGIRAKDIIKNFQPNFKNKDEYLAYCDSLACSGDRIIYGENETKIRL